MILGMTHVSAELHGPLTDFLDWGFTLLADDAHPLDPAKEPVLNRTGGASFRLQLLAGAGGRGPALELLQHLPRPASPGEVRDDDLPAWWVELASDHAGQPPPRSWQEFSPDLPEMSGLKGCRLPGSGSVMVWQGEQPLPVVIGVHLLTPQPEPWRHLLASVLALPPSAGAGSSLRFTCRHPLLRHKAAFITLMHDPRRQSAASGLALNDGPFRSVCFLTRDLERLHTAVVASKVATAWTPVMSLETRIQDRVQGARFRFYRMPEGLWWESLEMGSRSLDCNPGPT